NREHTTSYSPPTAPTLGCGGGRTHSPSTVSTRQADTMCQFHHTVRLRWNSIDRQCILPGENAVTRPPRPPRLPVTRPSRSSAVTVQRRTHTAHLPGSRALCPTGARRLVRIPAQLCGMGVSLVGRYQTMY